MMDLLLDSAPELYSKSNTLVCYFLHTSNPLEKKLKKITIPNPKHRPRPRNKCKERNEKKINSKGHGHKKKQKNTQPKK
jgi:hypothetical protein